MKRANQQKGKKGAFVYALKILVLLCASLLICLTTYAVYLTKKAETAADKAYEEIEDREKSEKRETAVEPTQDNVSILFIGVDDSENRQEAGLGNPRSDALLLATLNQEARTVKLVSIPRDSFVYVPYLNYKDKITHAHAFGGTLATIETVEELFDIPVDYYVKMNFNAFIDVVDAVGGIDIEVPYDRLELDENDQRTIQLREGFHTLDGREALALARTRYLDSDIERGKRQQEILKAIAKKAANITSIGSYGAIIDAVGANMKTDMTFEEMKSFFAYLIGGIPQIDTLTLDGQNGSNPATGAYIWELDQQHLIETQNILKSHLGLIEDSSNLSGVNPSESASPSEIE
ncbi:LCP family protein [Ureibacillus acetophenoni]|uniref:LytR family transcriptional attenuator n=1 Tax=Ureibacillus acetophenoni TaxID=614649 RepID=A0A285TZ22_9BACL|nr:LCP family protein [Ureibacillus acetophenoni]SOC34934.1 LytR family transcriptional attenuator [Ureibacillus acetophenoni]